MTAPARRHDKSNNLASGLFHKRFVCFCVSSIVLVLITMILSLILSSETRGLRRGFLN